MPTMRRFFFPIAAYGRPRVCVRGGGFERSLSTVHTFRVLRKQRSLKASGWWGGRRTMGNIELSIRYTRAIGKNPVPPLLSDAA